MLGEILLGVRPVLARMPEIPVCVLGSRTLNEYDDDDDAGFLFFLFIFYSPFVLRNYSTDFRKIFRNCVFWCSLNNPVVLNLFWCHLAEINAKTAKICSKFQGLTQIFHYNFKTVKDNSNLKQT